MALKIRPLHIFLMFILLFAIIPVTFTDTTHITHAGASISLETNSVTVGNGQTGNAYYPIYFGANSLIWTDSILYANGYVYSNVQQTLFYGNMLIVRDQAITQYGLNARVFQNANSSLFVNNTISSSNQFCMIIQQSTTAGCPLGSTLGYYSNGIIWNNSINQNWLLYAVNDSYAKINGQQTIVQQNGAFWEICNQNIYYLYFQGQLVYSSQNQNVGCYMWSGLSYVSSSTNFVAITPMWIHTVYSSGCNPICTGNPHDYLYYLIGNYAPFSFSSSNNQYLFDTNNYGFIDLLPYQNDTVQIFDGNNYITIFDQTANTLTVYQKQNTQALTQPYVSITFSGSNVIENMVGVWIQYHDNTNMYVGYLTTSGITILDTEPLTSILPYLSPNIPAFPPSSLTTSYNYTGSSGSVGLTYGYDYAVGIDPSGGSFYEYLSWASNLTSASYTVRIITTTAVTPQPILNIQISNSSYSAFAQNDIGYTLEWGLANAGTLPTTWISNVYPQYLAITTNNQLVTAGSLTNNNQYLWARNYGSFGFSQWVVYTIMPNGTVTNSTPTQSGNNSPSSAFSLSLTASSSSNYVNTAVVLTLTSANTIQNATLNLGTPNVAFTNGTQIPSGVLFLNTTFSVTIEYTQTGYFTVYATGYDIFNDYAVSNYIYENITQAGAQTPTTLNFTVSPTFCATYPCTVGATVTLGALLSNYYIANFSINWGDSIAGYTYVPNVVGFTNSYSVTHTYNQSGIFQINGVLFDTFGNIYSLGPVSVTVLNTSVNSSGNVTNNAGLGTITTLSTLLSQSLGIPINLAIQFLGIMVFALFATIGLYLSYQFRVPASLSTSILMIIGGMVDLVFFGYATAWILVIAILLSGIQLIHAFMSTGISIIPQGGNENES